MAIGESQGIFTTNIACIWSEIQKNKVSLYIRWP